MPRTTCVLTRCVTEAIWTVVSGLLLLIRKAVNAVPPGGVLEIRSTEISVREDLPAWCRMTKNPYLGWAPADTHNKYFVRKGESVQPEAALAEQQARDYRWQCRALVWGCSARYTVGTRAGMWGSQRVLMQDAAPSAVEYVLGALGACWPWASRSTPHAVASRWKGSKIALSGQIDNIFVFLGLDPEGHAAVPHHHWDSVRAGRCRGRAFARAVASYSCGIARDQHAGPSRDDGHCSPPDLLSQVKKVSQPMRAWPLFPVTVVGSLPRPQPLLDALRRRQAKRIHLATFDRVVAQAVQEAVTLQEQAGVDIVSDGEQRRDNFYSFIVEYVDGIRLMSLAELLDYVENKAAFESLLNALDVPAFAIKNPVVIGPVRRRQPLALTEYQGVRAYTQRPIKIALPGRIC